MKNLKTWVWLSALAVIAAISIFTACNLDLNKSLDTNNLNGNSSCEGAVSSPSQITTVSGYFSHNGTLASGCESYYMIGSIPTGASFSISSKNIVGGTVNVEIFSDSSFTSSLGSTGWVSAGKTITGTVNSSSLYIKASIGTSSAQKITFTIDGSITSSASASCGNGFKETSEQCDDGNTVSGDGCSSTCQFEVPNPVCGNGYKETGEQCDDGNTVSGDGCSSTCQLETAGTVDLQITSFSVSNTTAFNAALSVTVKNSGSLGAGSFSIMGWGNRIGTPDYTSAQSGCMVSESTGLAAGASNNYTIICSATYMPSTSYTAYVIVDFSQAVTETDENNNTKSSVWTAN